MKDVFAVAAFILWACSAGAAQEMSYGQAEYLNSCAICEAVTTERIHRLAEYVQSLQRR